MDAIRKIIAIDGQNAEHAARNFGFQHFPLQEFLHIVMADGGADVIDML